VLANRSEAQKGLWAFRLNPDGQTTQKNLSIVHGLDFTYTMSAKSFLNLAVRQNIVDYTDMAYDDVNDPRYDAAGALISVDVPGPARGAWLQGVDFTRFEQYTNAVFFKGSFVKQFSN